MSNIPEIKLAPDVVAYIGGFAVNNAMVGSLATTLIILVLVLVVSRRIALIPGRTQVVAEFLVGFFHSRLVDTYGDNARARRQTALIISFFLFILIANQFSLIPLVQSFVVNGVSVFKTPTAHLSQTLSLAIAVSVISHMIAFSISPLKHIGNYIKIQAILDIRSPKDIGQAFLEVFLGILDIIGEISKVISLSCRLFGNIFAGEVMIAVIAGLSVYTQFLVPIPFYVLSIFSGIIQALVFAFLSLSFISGTIISVESDENKNV